MKNITKNIINEMMGVFNNVVQKNILVYILNSIVVI